jgi:hypothetical protein
MTDETISDAERRWLEGALDIHIHTGPSIFPRLMNDHELAGAARRARMRGVVIKAHEGSTVERAAQIDDAKGLRVFGGIALNRFVGGLNPIALECALALGARIVWMPTLHAANHLAFFGKAGFHAQKSSTRESAVDAVEIVDADGRLLPDTQAILDLMAAHPDVALSSGHLSAPEVRLLFQEARRRGIGKLLLTHPELPVSGFDLDFQIEMAGLGAMIERNVLPHFPDWGGVPISRTVAEVRALGAERCILATDFGQANKPTPPAGLADFCDSLLEHGLEEKAITTLINTNPANLLLN